jgi:hypothetical protein
LAGAVFARGSLGIGGEKGNLSGRGACGAEEIHAGCANEKIEYVNCRRARCAAAVAFESCGIERTIGADD